ncbi:MAG: rhodanese-like domain-containing protein [Gammaproteobacteria bacterium]|nr:rhodanese-like domain-containing protein [Gammaproteobacteria bacterium]
MTMKPPAVSFDTMISRADDAVTTLSPGEVNEHLSREGVLLVDIRDVRELEREGRIPGSKHIPRGMLEFWMHPDSPYFKPYFEDANEVVLHCNRGWRSALAAKALLDIGIDVAHMSGGYSEWVERDLPTEPYVKK